MSPVHLQGAPETRRIPHLCLRSWYTPARWAPLDHPKWFKGPPFEDPRRQFWLQMSSKWAPGGKDSRSINRPRLIERDLAGHGGAQGLKQGANGSRLGVIRTISCAFVLTRKLSLDGQALRVIGSPNEPDR